MMRTRDDDMGGPQNAAVVLISDERMLRELLAANLRGAAPELSIIEAELLSELEPNDIRSATVVVFMRRSASAEELADELRQAQQAVPDASLAIISDFRDTNLIQQAFELGVNGFISTHMSAVSLVHYIRLLSSDGEVISPRIMAVLEGEGEADIAGPDFGKPIALAPLPPLERKVLERLREGKPNKIIGAELGLHEGEVKARVRNLMRRFFVRNRVQLVLATNHLELAPAAATEMADQAVTERTEALRYRARRLAKTQPVRSE